MTIESGELCRHCSDGEGNLIAFEECVERFMQWTKRSEPGLGDDEARKKTIAYMATMPAWKERPELLRALRAE